MEIMFIIYNKESHSSLCDALIMRRVILGFQNGFRNTQNPTHIRYRLINITNKKVEEVF